MKKTLSAILALSFILNAPMAQAGIFKKLIMGAVIVGGGVAAYKHKQGNLRGDRNPLAQPATKPSQAQVNAYNQANEERFNNVMKYATSYSDIKNTEWQKGSCVPMSLHTLLRGQYGNIGTYGDVNGLSLKMHNDHRFYADILHDGSDPEDIMAVLAETGYPAKRIIDWHKPALINDIVAAVENGYGVFIFLDAPSLFKATTGTVWKETTLDEKVLGSPHLVRAIALKRKPNGEIDRIAIYDPVRGSNSSFVQMPLFIEAMNTFRIRTKTQSVFITEKLVTAPIHL